MPATQTDNPPSFESVWAALQETAQIVKENAKEVKEFRESQRESQKEYAEHLKETERILKEESQRQKEEFNIRIGALTTLFGDVTEAMIAPKICEKFEEFGLYFPKANPNFRLNDRIKKFSFEVDIMPETAIKLKFKISEQGGFEPPVPFLGTTP